MRLKNKWMGGALAALLLLVGCRPVETTEITFGGDIILARDGQALFMDNPWGAFAAAEAPVSDANSLFFANLESPLGLNNPSDEAGPYNLCADAGLAEQLRAGGLSLVNTVNNHAEDCALANASTEELAVEGIRSVDVASNPLYMDTPAGKIGVLAANALAADWDPAILIEQATQARKWCDILVVSLHWGGEYVGEVSQEQRDVAQGLADAGVDVLWGHHAHLLQPMEWLTAADGQHHMLAMYGLGNLLTDQWMGWETQHGALVTVRFVGTEMSALTVRPVWMDPSSRSLQVPDEDSSNRVVERLDLGSLPLEATVLRQAHLGW